MAVVLYHADFTWAAGGFLGVEVVDWNKYGSENPDLFGRDKVHLTPEGQVAFAVLLDRIISGT